MAISDQALVLVELEELPLLIEPMYVAIPLREFIIELRSVVIVLRLVFDVLRSAFVVSCCSNCA
jgi:hypothetical protein